MQFEITAPGFYGGTDETNDRVIWVEAPSKEAVQSAIDGLGCTLWGGLDCLGLSKGNGIDYVLPDDLTELRARLLYFQTHPSGYEGET